MLFCRGKAEDLDRFGHAPEAPCDLAGVLEPGFVNVGDDPDVSALEIAGERGGPFSGPTWRGSRGKEPARGRVERRSHLKGGLCVFFAFDDYDRMALADGLQHFGKEVGNALDAFDRPRPAALRIGPALPEPLRIEAHDLVEEGPLRVVVVVGGRQAARTSGFRCGSGEGLVWCGGRLGGSALFRSGLL
jgi:hypothetical protein